MAVKKQKCDMGGSELYRIWSDKYVKIQCDQDCNLYSMCYITPNSLKTFSETDIPVDYIKPGIDASNVSNLSSYVVNVINDQDLSVEVDKAHLSAKVLDIISSNNDFVSDVLDGERDNQVVIYGGDSDF